MIPILDNGHGGIINGVYQTKGKRSPKWSKGVLYEGAFNRWIINGVMKELDYLGKPYFNISPEINDVPLRERVSRANKLSRKEKTYFLSVHANAGRGTGWEIFTSPGETRSDAIATKFIENFEKVMPLKPRFDLSDGDKDKEAKFTVLTDTVCPAILIECGFMDNKKDYELLWDRNFQQLIIGRIVATILELY